MSTIHRLTMTALGTGEVVTQLYYGWRDDDVREWAHDTFGTRFYRISVDPVDEAEIEQREKDSYDW